MRWIRSPVIPTAMINLADKLEDKVKGIEAERCQARYDSVVGEAQEKIEDAEKELADGKKEADEELADAKKKLDDGEQELTDGEKEYERWQTTACRRPAGTRRWQKTACRCKTEDS